MKKPFAWSWSALSSFELCPYRHYLTKVVKAYPEATNSKMLEGQRKHKALELRIARKKTLPPDMQGLEPMMQRFEKAAAGGVITAEKKIGLTRDLTECEYFDPQVWLRTVIDLQIDKGPKSLIIDYKTGKVKEGYDQLALSAAVKFAITPSSQQVRTSYLWLEADTTTDENFVRADAAGVWGDLLPRVMKLEKAIEETNFPQKPSGICRVNKVTGESYCPCVNCPHNELYAGG
jgi:hypothetical protein